MTHSDITPPGFTRSDKVCETRIERRCCVDILIFSSLSRLDKLLDPVLVLCWSCQQKLQWTIPPDSWFWCECDVCSRIHRQLHRPSNKGGPDISHGLIVGVLKSSRGRGGYHHCSLEMSRTQADRVPFCGRLRKPAIVSSVLPWTITIVLHQ